MRMLIVAIVAACMSAAAQANTVENSFGNTIVARSADGQEAQWRYYPDHTYTMTANGQTSRGVWRHQPPDQLCLTPEGGAEACFPNTDDKHVGETWSIVGSDGATTTLTMIPGQ